MIVGLEDRGMCRVVWVLCLLILPTWPWAEESVEPSLEATMDSFDIGDDTRRLKIKLAGQLVVRTDVEDTGDRHETDTLAEIRRIRPRFDASFLKKSSS